MEKTIKIGETTYKLPQDESTRRTVLNHLDMVMFGKKQYIKLIDLEGDTHQLSYSFLNGERIIYDGVCLYGDCDE